MPRALMTALSRDELWTRCTQRQIPRWCAAEAAVITELRLARRWSQRELCRRSGVKRQTIGDIERLDCIPRTDSLIYIVSGFGLRRREFDDCVECWALRNHWPL